MSVRRHCSRWRRSVGTRRGSSRGRQPGALASAHTSVPLHLQGHGQVLWLLCRRDCDGAGPEGKAWRALWVAAASLLWGLTSLAARFAHILDAIGSWISALEHGSWSGDSLQSIASCRRCAGSDAHATSHRASQGLDRLLYNNDAKRPQRIAEHAIEVSIVAAGTGLLLLLALLHICAANCDCSCSWWSHRTARDAQHVMVPVMLR